MIRNLTQLAIAFLLFCIVTVGQTASVSGFADPPSKMRFLIEGFSEDYGSLNRLYSARTSAARSARLLRLYSDDLKTISAIDFDALNQDEKIDYLLFKNYLEHETKEQVRYDAQLAEMSDLLPFMRTISDLEDQRRRLETIDPAKTAKLLDDLAKQIAATQSSFGGSAAKPKRTVAYRAVRTADEPAKYIEKLV